MKARDNEGKNERDILLPLLAGLRGLHRHPQLSPTPKMLPVLSVGCGVGVGGAGAPLPVPCLSQAWAGPPRGSFLVSSVVTSPAEEAPGVPDTQSTTLRTNLEMEKQIKLK